MTKKRSSYTISFLQVKTRKELLVTKDVKISLTIEIENGQKMTAEFVIQSNHFGEQMMEIQKQIGEMTGEAVLESYDDQIWTELSDHTFRYQEIKAKDQVKSRVSRRKKSKTFEYCGQHASFPIPNAGKASVPYFDLFRNIIHPELLS